MNYIKRVVILKKTKKKKKNGFKFGFNSIQVSYKEQIFKYSFLFIISWQIT